MKKAVFYYYTGTGNTLRAMTIISRQLEEKGWAASLIPVSRGLKSENLNNCGLLVLGFPALGFSAPTLVLRRLKELPSGGGCPAAVFCSVGSSWSDKGIIRGWSGTAVFKAARMLSRRNFKVCGSADISYPENWTQMINPPVPEVCAVMICKGDEEALKAGRDLAAGTPGNPGSPGMLKRTRISRISGFPAVIFRILGRVLLTRTFSVDGTCTGCGLCAARCPANSLVMKGGRPWWKSSCTGCNRCINLCPTRSIQTSLLRLVLVAGLNLAALILVWPAAGNLLIFLLPDLSGFSFSLSRILSGTGLFLLATFLQLVPLDWFLRLLERIPGAGKFFGFSFTSKFRRYLAPGFTGRTDGDNSD